MADSKQKRYDDDFLEEEMDIGGKKYYKDVRSGAVSDTPHVPKTAMKGVVRSKDSETFVNKAGTMPVADRATANAEKGTVGGGLAAGVVGAAKATKQAEAIEETDEEKKKKAQKK